MKKAVLSALYLGLLSITQGSKTLPAQEATSGVDLRATVTGQTVASNELSAEPRSGSPMIAGFHSILYPTLKLNDNWFLTGAVQLVTRPYYFEQFSTPGSGANGNLLQATLNYSRISPKASILVRAGQMSTAFGAFMLHYDDADNPLVDLPSGYGYYYSPVSVLGMAGAQIDATGGRWDGRVQFANSSPAAPLSVFARGQYGNWAGGAGFTIRQGFRVGVSGYRGPYLDRKYSNFLPGQANLNTLTAQALGVDLNWAHGHTSAQIELDKFVLPSTQIPRLRESTGYGEVKQVLSPRWFAAVRYGFTTTTATSRSQTVEAGAGFRPDRFQLIKIAYEIKHYSTSTDPDDKTLAIQFVTTLHKSFGHE
jgi:hypothetical protein